MAASNKLDVLSDPALFAHIRGFASCDVDIANFSVAHPSIERHNRPLVFSIREAWCKFVCHYADIAAAEERDAADTAFIREWQEEQHRIDFAWMYDSD